MCAEGEFLAIMLDQMSSFGHSYYSKITDICQWALRSWAAVWGAWLLTDLAMSRPRDPKQVVDQLLRFIIIDGLYTAPQMAWEFCDTILSFGFYAASKAYMSTSSGGTPTGMAELVCYGLGGIDDALFTGAKHLLADMSIWALGNAILTVVIWVLVSFLMVKIIKYSAIPLTRFFAIFVLLPLILFMAAIPWFQRAAQTATKILASAAKELILVAAIVGLFIEMIVRISQKLPISKDAMVSGASDWLGSQSYWFVVFAIVLFWFIFDEVMAIPAQLLEIIVQHSKIGAGKAKA